MRRGVHITNHQKWSKRILLGIIVLLLGVYEFFLFSGFSFTMTGYEGAGMWGFIITAFWVDICTLPIVMLRPKIAVNVILCNIVVTIAYLAIAALVLNRQGFRMGWPGNHPLELLFLPKLVVAGLIRILGRESGSLSGGANDLPPSTRMRNG